MANKKKLDNLKMVLLIITANCTEELQLALY